MRVHVRLHALPTQRQTQTIQTHTKTHTETDTDTLTLVLSRTLSHPLPPSTLSLSTLNCPPPDTSNPKPSSTAPILETCWPHPRGTTLCDTLGTAPHAPACDTALAGGIAGRSFEF